MGGVENPDWLPDGWKVGVKVRKSSGKKDKYYVDPLKGLRFNSKPEVLRYLEDSKEKDQKPKNPKEVGIEKTVPQKLPPGWIKEIKVKKKGGKTRRDPCYIDPVSGRHFRSMQEVFRYLESKGSEKAESEQDDKDRSQSSSPEAERQKSINKKADKTLTKKERVKSGPEPASGIQDETTNKVNVSKEKYLNQIEEDDPLATELSDKLRLVNNVEQFPDRATEIRKPADNKDDEKVYSDQRLGSGSKISYAEQKQIEDDYVAGKLPIKPPKVSGNEKNEVGRRQSKRLADGILKKDDVIQDTSLKSGSEDDAVENRNTSETNDIEQREKKNNSSGEGKSCEQEDPSHQSKRQQSNSKWASKIPRRASKRLAQIEADPSIEVQTSKKARPSDEPEVDKPSRKPAKSNDLKELPTKCKSAKATNSKQPKTVSTPLEKNISSLKEHKSAGFDSKEDKNPKKKHIEFPLNDIMMDPCIEFAIKTLTGAIPIEDLKKVGDCESPVSSSRALPAQPSAASASVLHFGDVWSDPCFEFAVKTLTGDTPIDSPPKFRLDNYYPSNNYAVSQSDVVVKKPCVRQQAGKDPTLPTTNFGIHQGIQGRNGNFV